jgi:hypothetical protein
MASHRGRPAVEVTDPWESSTGSAVLASQPLLLATVLLATAAAVGHCWSWCWALNRCCWLVVLMVLLSELLLLLEDSACSFAVGVLLVSPTTASSPLNNRFLP